MDRNDARILLQERGYLKFENNTWRHYSDDDLMFTCATTDEGEYECCRSDFKCVEEALDHLEEYCEGKWEEIW